jgi:hypothetical protein
MVTRSWGLSFLEEESSEEGHLFHKQGWILYFPTTSFCDKGMLFLGATSSAVSVHSAYCESVGCAVT